MFGWLFKKRDKDLEEKTERGFSAVRKDMDSVGKWIKHLSTQDKQLFDLVRELERELSSMREEIEGLREGLAVGQTAVEDQQVFEKTAVYRKQTAVEDVEEAVQTAVQTDDFYDIFKGLSANERLILFTLANSDMKLSYEDLALLLGKERSTIRGQINAIKQKHEGLVEEMVEKSGKKRVYIPEEVRNKLSKYAKVRAGKKKKVRVKEEEEEKGVENE